MSSVFRANDRWTTYIRQLRSSACHNAAYMDHRRTGDGTNPFGSGSFAKRTYSQHIQPADKRHPWGMTPVGTPGGSTALFDDSAFRDQSGLQITPQGDRQFARQGDDHDAPDAPLLTLGSVMEPPGQSAIRLMAEPKPCGFDHGNPCPPIACLGDALAAVSVTAVIGTGRNPDIACDLSAIGEPPIIDLPREGRGQSRAEALQA